MGIEIWISGEIDADVAQGYLETRRRIEQEVNTCLRERNYGTGLAEWTFLAIIRRAKDPHYPEVIRHKKKARSCEFRLKVSHEAFIRGDEAERDRLLFAAIQRAAEIISSWAIAEFDGHKLVSDLAELGRSKGWTT